MQIVLEKVANLLTSVAAGLAAFVFTLSSFLMLREVDQQLMASFTIGLFALAITWIAYERPNSSHSRAVSALIERLLAVRGGDLTSPAPPAVQQAMPDLAAAIDALFEQVRSTLDDAHAIGLYDPVTSLANRTHFNREAERMLAARRGDQIYALLFLDLDRFKQVNDTEGHARGDQILALVAERLREVVREEGHFGSLAQPLLARYAGDEFVMLFPAVAHAGEADHIAHRALEKLIGSGRSGDDLGLGASIGIAMCPRDATDLTGLLHAADSAMYRAKADGRSRACFYHPRLDTEPVRLAANY